MYARSFRTAHRHRTSRLFSFPAHMFMWYKDISRAIDYIETRDDIDIDRLAVLRLCGLPTWDMNPAYDLLNFVPRIKIPILMINGRYDYIFPHETSQVPMFELLGTPPDNKRYVILETAHSVGGHRNTMIRETLDWLDRHLGPVRK